jgi:hypothetical protein
MFKKVNTTVLVVALLVLLGIYFIVEYTGNNDRSFKDVIVSYEPAEVFGIVIQDPQNDAPVQLNREGDRWFVQQDGKKYPADSNVVKSIVQQLGNLETKRYAGKGEEVWQKYQVNDSLATVVELNDGKEPLARVYIGRFSYSMPSEQQQQQMMAQGRQNQPQDMTTFVRLDGEKEVYGVDGFLKMNFNRNADAYRDKTLTNLNHTDITSASLKMPSGNIELSKTDNTWLVNGTPADSTKMANYLRKLEKVRGSAFVDESMVAGMEPTHEASFRGNNFLSLDIQAYPVADTNIRYVMHSSQNPSAYFEGKISSLFEKVFVSKEELLPD